VLGVNFGQSYASIAVIDKEGHPQCIANEEGERQIACAISYAGEQVVRYVPLASRHVGS
jgi:molecular chaperone DnaK (HSP70)